MIRKVIQYYYNLYPEQIDREIDRYIFKVNNDLYHFEVQKRTEEELILINELNKNVNLYNPIIMNKFKKLISSYGNRNYILIKVIKPIRNLKMEDILTTVRLYNHNNSLLLRNQWSKLWEKKIDNIEYQQGHIIHKFPLIDQSLGYYIGMSESAIAYFESIDKKNLGYYISHVRINSKKSTIDFFNPQNIVIDFIARDVAEYLKSLFLYKEYNYNEIAKMLEQIPGNDSELRLVFCRLNYPSLYFDMYEEIIGENKEEYKIEQIIKRNEEYREFLKNIFYMINRKINIKNIEWITK